MASLIIRSIEEEIKHKLRVRAAHHGHSMEEELRQILRSALAERNLATSIRQRFVPLGGVELTLPERETIPEPRWSDS